MRLAPLPCDTSPRSASVGFVPPQQMPPTLLIPPAGSPALSTVFDHVGCGSDGSKLVAKGAVPSAGRPAVYEGGALPGSLPHLVLGVEPSLKLIAAPFLMLRKRSQG